MSRQKIGGTAMKYFTFTQLSVLPPEKYTEIAPWSGHETYADWLKPRVLETTYTSIDLSAFAEELGDHGPPFRWDPERRVLLRAELDAAYFHLYGVDRDDVDYVLDTFPIVKRKDEAKYGEYRTKRLILEIYDAMAKAIDSAEPYETVLDPPPGHGPRHAARGRCS